jgi:hypothetical protein
MRKLSVVVLVVLASGVGFLLGHTRVARRGEKTTRPSITGNINVAGDSFRVVDGDLEMRSLPDGTVELVGNLNVRPN